jgi:hypothetical protein
VPAGWPAGVENSYSGSHSGELSRTSDERLLRQSDLYIELPASAELSETHDAVATRIGDDIVELRISYTSGIEIFRWRPALPLNMERTLEGGGRLFETGTVAGSPAVFYRSPPGDAPGDSIWFIKDGILTQISGGLPFDDLLAIAELVP